MQMSYFRRLQNLLAPQPKFHTKPLRSIEGNVKEGRMQTSMHSKTRQTSKTLTSAEEEKVKEGRNSALMFSALLKCLSDKMTTRRRVDAQTKPVLQAPCVSHFPLCVWRPAAHLQMFIACEVNTFTKYCNATQMRIRKEISFIHEVCY